MMLPAHVRPPRRRAGLLPRAGLVARIARAALDKRLVLLSAASGFGKTTLLADCHRHLTDQGVPCLWLNVTEGDHDAAWLARALVEQMARLHDTEPLAGEDFGSLASRLVGEQPVVVLIDNWNFLESVAANSLFDRIMAETEGLANFVVTSRTIPGFVFETLRLADAFAGFSARDLAFTADEAGAVLLGDAPPSLPMVDLIERTEGWPAGVQLLRLALAQNRGEVPSGFEFRGSRPDVADYLGKAFFRHLPADRRAFLCNIAVLEEVSGEIAGHVLDDPAAEATFQSIERDNLFLAEAAEGSGRFRFHSLFRDFLLSQHPREASVAKVSVLGRAVDYHAARGENDLAIRYAIEARRGDVALDLLAQIGPKLGGEGKVHQYAAWVEAFRREGFATNPTIDHWYCWSLVFGGRWRESMAFLRAHHAPADPEIVSIIAAFSDDQPALRASLEAWRGEACRGDAFRSAVMQSAAVINALAQGQVDQAVEASHHARFAIDRTESVFGRVWVQVVDAFSHLMKGRADLAEATVREGIRACELMLGVQAPVARVARLMAAIIAWHRCADDQALRDLAAADRSADEHGLPMIVVGASSVAAALGVEWRNRRIENTLTSPAIALVKEAYRVEAALQKAPSPAVAADVVRLFELRLADARRDVPALLQEGWMLRDLNLAIQARLRLIEGDAAAALHLLTPAIVEAQKRGRGLAVLHLSLLRAAALHRLGKGSAALRLLIQTAELAVKGGLYRPFLGERAFIAELLPALAEAGARAPIGDPAGWRGLLAHLGMGTAVSEQTARAAAIDDNIADHEPLTEREREMLGLIDVGLSNQEIADRSGVSVPTVKWHLHNLFSKLGVRNRVSAVRVARARDLLRP